MKKTIILLLLVTALCSLGAATVYVGAEAGLNGNAIIAGKGYSGYDYTKMFGGSLSVPVVVEFTPNLALQTGASFVMKDYIYSKTITYQGQQGTVLGYVCMNGFAEIPFALRCSVNFGKSNWGAFATVGGFVGFWAGGIRTGKVYGFMSSEAQDVEDDLDLDYYNKVQAGVSASAGFDVEFGSFDAYLSVQYALSLTDLNKTQKYAQYPVHNSTVTVAAGLLWGVNK